MNSQMIIGNLVRDPETGTTESGVGWCTFVVAVKKRYHREGEPDADFVRVTAWRKLADSCGKYLRKGKKVYVNGVPQVSVWIGRDDGKPRGQIELVADEVEFLSSGGNGNGKPTDADVPGGVRETDEKKDEESGMTVTDPDDLPF